MLKEHRLAVVTIFFFGVAFILDGGVSAADEWSKIGGSGYAVSGMALLTEVDGRSEFLVVHDNLEGPRLGVVSIQGRSRHKPKYRPLQWPGKLPDHDLEAISALPGKSGKFLILSSQGQVYLLSVAKDKVMVLTDFLLPALPSEVNLEGLDVQEIGGRMLVVWGHRGAGEQRGILFSGLLDLEGRRVASVVKTEITAPHPLPNDPHTRHISELQIASDGTVWASATNDPPGNAGPFVSVIYTLGVLRVTEAQEFYFDSSIHKDYVWTFARKVEALEFCSDGGVAFGADDEANGGWVTIEWNRNSVPSDSACGLTRETAAELVGGVGVR